MIKIRKEIKLDHWYSLELMKNLEMFRIFNEKLDNNNFFFPSKYSLPTIEIDLFGTKHFSDFSGRLPKGVKHRLIFCANTESELSMLNQSLRQNGGVISESEP